MTPCEDRSAASPAAKMNQSRSFRKPPDVEEALSSMLWTPYDNNASDSDSSLDDGPSPLLDPSVAPGRLTNNSHPRSSVMKRSFSEWDYRSERRTKAEYFPPEAGGVSNRYSYPYYSPYQVTSVPNANGYWSGNNIYAAASYPTGAAASVAPPAAIFPMLPPISSLGWKQFRSTASGVNQLPHPPLVPTDPAPLLPFSLLSMDSIPLAACEMIDSSAYGCCGGDDLINSNVMFGIGGTFSDYQVYSNPQFAVGGGCSGAYLSHRPQPLRQSSSPSLCSSLSEASGFGKPNGNNNNNNHSYDNNNSICKISAILKPVMRSSSTTNSGNVGDLHFPKHQQQRPQPQPQQHSIDNATRSCSTTTTLLELDEHRANERPKWNEQNMGPFNGNHHMEVTGCEGGERSEGRATGAATNGSDHLAFSSVRIVNGEAYANGSDLFASERRLFAANDRLIDSGVVNYSGSGSFKALDSLRGFGRTVRDRFVDIMRLNVPAAPKGSRTSVYIPSAEGTANAESAISHGDGGGSTRPTLTIQVNRVDTNNQVQNDVVNNASSGVSIVNCYRETPKSADNNSGDQEGAVFSASENAPSDANSATIVNQNHVNISANAEQMVHVSNTVVKSVSNDTNLVEHNRSLKNSDKQQTIAYPLTDIDRIEPTDGRTYTSTEAQTEEPLIPSGTATLPYPHPTIIPGGGVPPPLPPHPSLLLSPPGSEFSTREHRRRERRERRQARNRMQHVHPMDQPPPPPPPLPSAMIRPPPIEIIPDILHSHLPPPYTTLPMGATVLPAPMIPAVPVHHRGAADDCRYSFPIPIIRSSPSERSRKGCCGHWFAGPPLRALIAVVALGGVACALGGAALGATGLAGSPTSHLTAALLMIGVGVILVTVSGAAWRMTAPGAPPCLGLGSTVDLARCSRRPCGRSGSTSHGLLYPEFQHRPPPPSYQASMQEYRLRLLLLDRDRQSGRMRSTASPPPTYRSNVGSLLRIPLTSRHHSSGGNGIGGANGGSSTSLFGGISGIISGAIGNSTNSINAAAAVTAAHMPPTAGSRPPSQSDQTNVGLLDLNCVPPPTYRTIDRCRNPSTPVTAQPQQQHQQHQIQHPPSPPVRTASGGELRGGNVLINDDNIVASPAGPQTSLGTAGGAPSIIKIDEGKSTTVVTGTVNTNASRTKAMTTTAGVLHPTATVQHKQRNSITREIIETDSNKASANKDLVTIVTISGTLERPALNKSLYGAVDAETPATSAVSAVSPTTLLNPALVTNGGTMSPGNGPAVAHL
ncbi:uncharacterized protein LOC129764421 isoform X2 [Toxorhynchites rutilus septentrionalis]|uniref:uncharacterized protein LOC129764421 isoform X2 n=1 Tax=Toxorhynchites rutilus septentrionalis TaxID=329112 RepID=UPI00247AD05B|nr:uncharacterized protein LOC129764421 isoform X2 [Toxorhynchites rutilus septentrionalis]